MASDILEQLYGNAVIEVSAATSPHVSPAEQLQPTTWQMAKSAASAAARFATSGLQRVSAVTRQERLAQCTGCMQFKGTRCAACGCVIAVKNWLPAETCPIGKWRK